MIKKLPLSQNDNVVVQNAGKETLVYNLLTNKAYCLNETSAIVFNACDGKTSFDDLKSKHKFTDDIIYFALDELKKENLIASEISEHFAGLSRREVIRKVGLGSMIALPVILSLVAPQASSAQSSCQGDSCTPNNFTQSDCCNSSFRCNGICSPCLGTNGSFAFAAPLATPTFCDAQPSKNLCCNSGPATGDGSFCHCP